MSSECTGISAGWCPVCGDCICPSRAVAMDTPDCPLHGTASRHASMYCAGGCGEIVAAENTRCDGCEIAEIRLGLERATAALRDRDATIARLTAAVEASDAAVREYLAAEDAISASCDARDSATTTADADAAMSGGAA